MPDRESLESILDARTLSALFQPILTCPSGEIWGHEALIRGPATSHLHSPLTLFQAAGRAGRLVELDLMCRSVAIEAFSRAGCPGRLFLNVNPEAVVANDHPTGETLRLLERHGVAPERIVIEITEQVPIHDYEIVRRAVAHYHANGFAVALDDLGTGYAGLRHWSELRPDYVKIDRYFAKGVEDDLSKREVVRSVIDMARRMGTRVIVEGIETEAEYSTLRGRGMTHAQGYLFARPARQPHSAGQSMPGERALTDSNSPAAQPTTGELAEPIAPEPPTASVDRILARFHGASDLRCIAVVNGSGHPLGVVRRNTLLSRLAHHYGYALFANRAISDFMETPTVTVPSDLSLEALSRRITEAPEGEESFLITDPQGRYHAVGSVYELLRRMTDLQVHSARHANPLTGLPGNVLIEQHIGSLLQAAKPFIVVHADLDHFKSFNDYYGYQRGDEVILATARLFQAHMQGDEFVGHVGGDDFVLVLNEDGWRSRCQGILDSFGERAPGFYDAVDRERGWIETFDRRGNRQQADVLSLSLAAVPVGPHQFSSQHVISTVLAEIKRCAKRQSGNSLFIDRRAHSAFEPSQSSEHEDSGMDGLTGSTAA